MEICSDISLGDAVISVYYWNYLQVGLFDLANYFLADMDWSLEQIENLWRSSRTSKMILYRFWISMAIINAELDAMEQ